MKNIRFGIAGLGVIARRFADVINSGEDLGAEITGVASASGIDKARAFSDEYSVCKYYDSYEKLASDDTIDIVYIATTHNFHYKNSMMFLNAGKPVLCEKPLCLNKREAVEITELAAKKNILIIEGMLTRFLPSYIKAKDWIADGMIGDIVLIDASFCVRLPPDPNSRSYNTYTAGGALYDLGVYAIEFALGITGETPVKIDANSIMSKISEVDEMNIVNLIFPSNILSQLRFGMNCQADNSAYIYGTGGRIVLPSFFPLAKSCELYSSDGSLRERFEPEYKDPFVYEIKHVVDLIREEKIESPLIKISDSILCAEIFDEIKKDFLA